jgi:hypothetical protein
LTEPEAIQMLQIQPLEFLRKNSLTPVRAVGVTGLHTFYMKDLAANITRPGKFLGNLSAHGGQRFKLCHNNADGGTPFQALHIDVKPSNVAIHAFPLTGIGASLMFTTQLTGCCIVMIPGGGTWSVAHLQPTGETGEALRNRLKAQHFQVYGVGDYTGVGRAVLVGVREGGVWHFYNQMQDAYYNVKAAAKLS